MAGASVFMLLTLRGLRAAHAREALALQHDLEQLRESLRVTRALLEVDVLEGAEPLEDAPDEHRESGMHCRPVQRISRP